MKKYFLIIALLLGYVVSIKAESHYVDKDVPGKNDGASWENAWISFENIGWNQINPGDTIYISGGTDSTIYYETFIIKSNGTSDKPIVISSSFEPNHDGKVICNGKMEKTDGVIIENYDYIIVKGLQVRNYTGRDRLEFDIAPGY